MDASPNAASVALIEGGRVLLIQRAREPYLGRWTLPGGRLEPGEDAATAAIREVGEELGLTIADLVPVTQMALGGTRFQLLVFATRSFTGAIMPSDEVADWRWAEPGALHDLPVTPSLPEVVGAALAMFRRT